MLNFFGQDLLGKNFVPTLMHKLYLYTLNNKIRKINSFIKKIVGSGFFGKILYITIVH